MATKKVAVRLVAENGRQVRAELEGVGNAGAAGFKRMSAEVDHAGVMIRRLGGILAAAFSARKIIDYADTWSDLNSRVALAVGSQEKGVIVMDRLASMARRTYSGLNQTAEGWLSVATSLRQLGLSTNETLDFTEALNNAMVVSGAKGERATQVQNALSKAMALGELRGENLNSVISAGGRVAELLADELGTTVAGLRKMGADGKITGEVIRTALVGNLQKLRDEADAMPATIGDAFVLLENAALTLVGTWDKLLGSSEMIAGALIVVADNLDRVAALAIAFATFMAGRWVKAFVAARVATLSLSTALLTLRTALIRTGIGALIVALGEVVYWLMNVAQSAKSTGDAFVRMYAVAKEVFLGIGRTAWGMSEILAGIASSIAGSFVRAFAEILRAWDLVANSISATWNLIADTGFGEKLGLGVLPKSDTAGTVGGLADKLFDQALSSIQSGGARISDAMAKIREAMVASTTGDDAAAAGSGVLDEAAASASRLDDALEKAGKAAGRAGAAGKAAGSAVKEGAEAAKTGWDAAIATLEDYVNKSRDIGGDLGNALVGAFRSAEDAIGEFVQTGKLEVKSLVTSIIADFAKLGARRFILGPLANGLSGLLGNIKVPFLHDGGMAGRDGRMGMVPAMAFAGASRFHSGGFPGLRSDEVPAILQRGERVQSRREVAAGAGSVTVNIQARDAESFRQSRAQIAADISRAVAFGRRGM